MSANHHAAAARQKDQRPSGRHSTLCSFERETESNAIELSGETTWI
jgi:hypothetical protein